MRVALRVFTIIVCLAAMSITTYAYFSYNVSSGSNILKTANFEADVSEFVDTSGEAVTVYEVDSKTHTAYLEMGKTYLVTLVKSENSTAGTGFCIVTADGCTDSYHTQQLGTENSVSFQLEVTANTTVTILSHWGTSAYYDTYKEEENVPYITSDETISMVIDGVTTTPGPSATPEATATPETTKAPAPSTTPEATTMPATTAEPVTTPVPSAEPVATPLPSTEPVATPLPSTAPTATPVPSTEPVEIPLPSAAPTETPATGTETVETPETPASGTEPAT